LISLEPNWADLKERSWHQGKDQLGRPFLTVGGEPGPAVSFSEAGGWTWAALAAAAQVGCDAAQAGEFPGGYPFHRVFHPEELAHASRLCGGDPGEAAALLWSLKEAAVKALGVAFHFMAPLELRVGQSIAWHGGVLFQVKAGRHLPAWARRLGPGWLAIAFA
jgi:phosphopantetheinyl transferase